MTEERAAAERGEVDVAALRSWAEKMKPWGNFLSMAPSVLLALLDAHDQATMRVAALTEALDFYSSLEGRDGDVARAALASAAGDV